MGLTDGSLPGTPAALRSPTLAGIISDPLDSTKRIVPTSLRKDGSARKEIKVRPGYVPSEDVAKYRVGRGSIQSQLVAAQAEHKAPVQSTPNAPQVVLPRNPSDFASQNTQREYPSPKPAPSPFKPVDASEATTTVAATPVVTPASPRLAQAPMKSGVSSSRWATAPEAPAAAASTGSRASKHGKSSSISKQALNKKSSFISDTSSARAPSPSIASPNMPSAAVFPGATTTSTPATPQIPQEVATVAEPVAPTSKPEPSAEQKAVPATSSSSSKLPLPQSDFELPQTIAGDNWWDDGDDDDDYEPPVEAVSMTDKKADKEVDAAAEALAGISIKGRDSNDTRGTVTEARKDPPASRGQSSSSSGKKAVPPLSSVKIEWQGTPSSKPSTPANTASTAKSRSNGHAKGKKSPELVNRALPAEGSLLSRISGEPTSAIIPLEVHPSSTPDHTQARPEKSPSPFDIDSMTLASIRNRSKTISAELRQLKSSPATSEQLSKIDSLTSELNKYKIASHKLSEELDQL